jgi:hypothetical protein
VTESTPAREHAPRGATRFPRAPGPRSAPLTPGDPRRIPLWADPDAFRTSAGPSEPVISTEPGDPQERAADQAADRVTGRVFAGTSTAEAAGAPAHHTAQGAAHGRPLAPSLRTTLESAFGHDLRHVRVHDDADGADRAHRHDADAVTEGADISFAAARFDPASRTGLRLLAHEIAHVVDPAAGAGANRVHRQGRSRLARSLAPVPALLSQADEALHDLLDDLWQIRQPSPALVQAIGGFLGGVHALGDELEATRTAEELLAGRIDPQVVDAYPPPALSVVGEYYFAAGNQQLSAEYFVDGHHRLHVERIARRAAQLRRGFTLVALTRARVVNLTSTAPGDPQTEAVRRVQHDLAAHYLEAALLPQDEGAARLTFLDTFFQDPARLQGFAVAAFIDNELPALWTNINRAIGLADTAGRFPLHREWSDEVPIQNPIDAQEAAGRTMQRLARLQAFVSKVGPVPGSVTEVGWLPESRDIASAVAELRQVYPETAVIQLWVWMEPLSDALNEWWGIGKHLLGGDAERRGWNDDLYRLSTKFYEEIGRSEHPKIEAQVTEWQATITRLYNEIGPAARHAAIARAIVESIPLMIVSTGASLGVAAWVARVWAGSEWLVPLTVLAEGTTMTAINTLAQLPSGRLTTSDVALDLGRNVAFAWLGRLVFGPAAATAQGLSATRRVLTAVGGITVLAGAQTAAQLIENTVRRLGGETDWTELLTVNLITNVLGLLVGATLRPGEAPVTGPPNDQLARATGPDQASTQAYAALAGRAAELQSRTENVQAAARQRTLSPADFDQWKSDAHRLFDDIEAQLPELALRLGLDHTPAQIHAVVAAYRAWLDGIRYDPGHPVRRLPEYTTGLTRSANETTWLADPGADLDTGPIGQLRRSEQEQAGITVRELPGRAGWEAVDDARGAVVLQVLARRTGDPPALPPSLEAVAGRDVNAQVGLAVVRGTSLTLESRLAQASLAAGGVPRVGRLLTIAGRMTRAIAAPVGAVETSEAALWARKGDVAAVAAIEAALSDPRAAYGLDQVIRQHPKAFGSVLLAVPAEPGRMTIALRALGDLGWQPLEFYRVLARNPRAQDLVDRFGGGFLQKIIKLRPEASPALALARATLDIDRVTARLGDPGLSVAQLADLVARTSRVRSPGGLDRIYGPRPVPNAQIETVLTDPNWPSYLTDARVYARDHPVEGGKISAEELQVRAALLQMVERARSGEFDRLSPHDLRALLEDFDRTAHAVRLEQGWINTRRAQIHEAAGSPGSRGLRVIWYRGMPQRTRVPDSSELDGSFPPVRPGDTVADLLVPKEWVEMKTDAIHQGTPSRRTGVYPAGPKAATKHLAGARADLNDNLVPGCTIALDYLHDPDESTRNEMLKILFTEPRIVRVRFSGTTYVRNGQGGFKVGRWGDGS